MMLDDRIWFRLLGRGALTDDRESKAFAKDGSNVVSSFKKIRTRFCLTWPELGWYALPVSIYAYVS